MPIPSRMEVRRWLVECDRKQINEFLTDIGAEHGPEVEKDIRQWLNFDRKQRLIDSPAEVTFMNEHEQRKADIEAEMKSRKRLYGNIPK